MFDHKEKNRLFFIIVSILLFFSGVAGLVYEVIWTRILHYSFGGTQAAAATVLATFMGGMAIGAALGGKLAEKFDRPLLVYAILQLFIAIFGLLFTPLLYHLDFIYNFTSPFINRGILTTVRFLVGVLIMGAPTIAMGATLPVIARGVVSKDTTGRGVGVLYFVNTLGAVLGTLLAGFIIIPGDGLDYGIKFAAGIGIFVALSSFLVQFRLKPPVMEEVVSSSEDKLPSANLFYSDKILEWSPYFILAFAFFTGFISLSNEILWFKLLGILLDGTIYGFSALLASFLLGLSLGSLWISKKIDQKKDLWKLFVKLQIGAGTGAVVTILLIPLIPFFASGYIAMGTRTPGSVFALKLFFVFCAILVPTFFYGASFPVLAKLSNLSSTVSKAVGNVYSFNTVGCIVGAVLTGIFFIPWLKDLNLLLLILIYLSFIMAFVAIFLAGGRDESYSIDTKLKLFGVVSILLLAVTVLKPSVNIIRLVNSRYSIEDYKNSFGSRILTLFGNNNSKSKELVFEAEGATTVVTV
ncbi:MAG: fused MFS/spermidine synthase, partial [Myxococcota bacterium]